MTHHYCAVFAFLAGCFAASSGRLCVAEQYESAVAGWFSYGGSDAGVAGVIGRRTVDYKRKMEVLHSQILEFKTGKNRVDNYPKEKYPMMHLRDYNKGKFYEVRLDKAECNVHPLPGEMIRLCDDGDNVKKLPDQMKIGQLMANVYTISTNDTFEKVTAFYHKFITPVTIVSETYFKSQPALFSMQLGNYTERRHPEKFFKVPPFCKDN